MTHALQGLREAAPVPGVGLRDARPGDTRFVFDVIDATMRELVVAAYGGWNESVILEEARRLCLAGEASIIRAAGADIGVLVVERHATHIQLEHMFILPNWQNQGIGTWFVRSLQHDAGLARVPLRLRVLAVNRARWLYERLGFVVVDPCPERFSMEWRP